MPRAYPFGICDIGRNADFVNVGTDQDTGAFAVALNSGLVAPGWETTLSKAQRLLITADGGGSNGWRLRLWKVQLQKFVDESGLFAATAVDHIAAHAAASNWASACREC